MHTTDNIIIIIRLVFSSTFFILSFLQRFVLPWFEGRGKQEERLTDIQSSVEQLETNIRDMVTSLNTSTNTLRVRMFVIAPVM